ncbi:hypothetical protein ACROYT_G005915 [Oculina patagonica]
MTTFIYVGSLVLYILTVFLKDANTSNWNIADSGTVRKSDVTSNENWKSVQINPDLQKAVHQSLDSSRTQAGITRQVVANETCRDNKEYEPFCKTYRLNDFCTLYPYGMQKYCALTCGFCKCKAKIDIGFLVDSSGSIEKAGKGNYKKCLDFIKTAVNGSFISETFTHAGLVVFSSKLKTIFTLKQFYDAEQMMDAIDNATYLKGGTLTGKALTFVKTELFDKTGRQGVPKVLIVMTDGKSTDDVIKPAKVLSDANITVFAIGIGRNYDITQLQEIASKPEIKYALTSDFNRLNDLYTSIRDDACRVNSTFSDQDVPYHTPAQEHGAFAPHGSHTVVPQIAVLKSKSRIAEHPHKHTRG